jgi:hypothetical protein
MPVMIVRSTCILLVFAGLALLPAKAAENNNTLVKVPLDVDVYDQPGGEGKKSSQFLNAGSEVYLLEERADHWCHIQFDKGGTGWIWCGTGEDGQDYSVQRVK